MRVDVIVVFLELFFDIAHIGFYMDISSKGYMWIIQFV